MEIKELTNLEDVPQMVLGDEVAKIENLVEKAETIENEPLLTEAEERAVKEFANKVDITNSAEVLQFGSAAQEHMATFSETALEKVRTKDMGEVGKSLASLVSELKGFSPSDEKGLGLFKKAGNYIIKLKAKYDKVEVNVDKIVGVLENHQITLLKDIALFEKMYEMNVTYLKELTMYIKAGKICLENANNTLLPQLEEKAKQSGLPEDAQATNDMRNMVNRFEKRIYDLELTKTMSIQMSPQIRLVQNNDSLMAEKIHSSIVNTIPLWKSQMVLALGLANAKEAIEAQQKVNDMTNSLLKKNADMLKQSSIETAKESEKGIIDIETLTYTNKQLIETIDEVLRIQEEGKAKRKVASEELLKIENELKQKLIEVKKNV